MEFDVAVIGGGICAVEAVNALRYELDKKSGSHNSTVCITVYNAYRR